MAVEYLIWGGGAIVLGLGLGRVAYSHSKLAYTVFVAFMAIFSLCIKPIVKMTGGNLEGLARMQSHGVDLSISGITSNLMPAINKMGFLPQHVQVSIVAFIIAFFLARIATWSGRKRRRNRVETDAQRRKRILKSYGMKSMNDVRKFY